MPSWRDEYLASLQESEKHNPVNLDLVQLCSQFSDRIAALEAEKAVLESKVGPATKDAKNETSAAITSADPSVAQLQLSLAEALRSKGSLQSRAKTAEDEVHNLRNKTRVDAKTIKSLSAERNILSVKLKDREHEIREKRKLVENVQDEMITLNLQVAIAEKERDKFKKENKELVERWMKRMAQEAEAMNLANEPLFEKSR